MRVLETKRINVDGKVDKHLINIFSLAVTQRSMPGILGIFSKEKHIPENKNHLKDVKHVTCLSPFFIQYQYTTKQCHHNLKYICITSC